MSNARTIGLTRSIVYLLGLSFALTALTCPLASHLDPEQGIRLCIVAGLTCFMVGLAVLVLPIWLPVAETYVMVFALGLGFRMLMPLIGCGILMSMVGLNEARVFAICLLIISPVLLFWETYVWACRLQNNHGQEKHK